MARRKRRGLQAQRAAVAVTDPRLQFLISTYLALANQLKNLGQFGNANARSLITAQLNQISQTLSNFALANPELSPAIQDAFAMATKIVNG